MLEILVNSDNVSGWKPPAEEPGTLFRMHTFRNVSDISDKGPHQIAVTRNGSVSVGRDDFSSYVNFPGSGAWLNFSSTQLDSNNIDLRFVIAIPTFTDSAMYPRCLIDGRPTNVNGNYIGWYYDNKLPFVQLLNHAGSTSPNSTIADVSEFPAEIILKVRPTGMRVFVNGRLVLTWNKTISLVSNAPYKIARSAFSSTIPESIFKMYYFDIRKGKD